MFKKNLYRKRAISIVEPTRCAWTSNLVAATDITRMQYTNYRLCSTSWRWASSARNMYRLSIHNNLNTKSASCWFYDADILWCSQQNIKKGPYVPYINLPYIRLEDFQQLNFPKWVHCHNTSVTILRTYCHIITVWKCCSLHSVPPLVVHKKKHQVQELYILHVVSFSNFYTN
jgi:hypothetical protein